MAEPGSSNDTQDRASRLRREYFGQTARIHWRELQTYYARGAVVRVAGELDMVEVAVQLGLDNTAALERWIGEGSVSAVTDEQALAWYQVNQQLWAVVAPPWVLVQQRGDCSPQVEDG
jgi:hypothetical protein